MRFFAHLDQLGDWALVALRLGVGTSFWVHGTSKRAMWKMAPSEQMPASFLSTLRLLSIVEPVGALALFVGFLTPPPAPRSVLIIPAPPPLQPPMMHPGCA